MFVNYMGFRLPFKIGSANVYSLKWTNERHDCEAQSNQQRNGKMYIIWIEVFVFTESCSCCLFNLFCGHNEALNSSSQSFKKQVKCTALQVLQVEKWIHELCEPPLTTGDLKGTINNFEPFVWLYYYSFGSGKM